VAFTTVITTDGLEVESELTGATLRVYSPQRAKRLFTVNVSHNGQGKARLTNGYGNYNFHVRRAITTWLKLNNFTSFTFERGAPQDGQRALNGNVA
jgi:hypothetical protein